MLTILYGRLLTTLKEFAKSDREYARYEGYSREDHRDKDRFMFECLRSNWEEIVKGLGEAIYIVWMSFGVVIEKINESVDSLEIFISVPKSSYRNDVHGNEMADIEYYIGAVCLIVGSIRESLTCLGRRWSGNYVDTRTISGICRYR